MAPKGKTAPPRQPPAAVENSEEEEKRGWTVDNFSVKLRKECLKVARNRDMTLTQFAEKWMRYGLEQETAEFEREAKQSQHAKAKLMK